MPRKSKYSSALKRVFNQQQLLKKKSDNFFPKLFDNGIIILRTKVAIFG
jgi:hypothetical protein